MNDTSLLVAEENLELRIMPTFLQQIIMNAEVATKEAKDSQI